MFGEDAVLGARLLDLTLTSRNRGKPDEIPMAGVPHHAAAGYVAKLLELGHKVALCEQMADPAKVKGIVPREVVRVITPGLVTDRDQLDAGTNNYLAAVELTAEGVGLALLDLSTGELAAATVPDPTLLLAELGRAHAREVLLGVDAACAADVAEATRAGLRALGRCPLRDDPPLALAQIPEALGELATEAAALSPCA